MGRANEKLVDVKLLRKNAEELYEIRKGEITIPENEVDLQKFIREQQIQQIELELQLKEFQNIKNKTSDRDSVMILNEEIVSCEEKYKTLIENTPIGVAVYQKGNFVFINKEGLKIVGAKSENELIGKPVLSIVHTDSQSEVIKRMKRVAAGESLPAFEEKLIQMDGSILIAEVAATSTFFNNKPAGQVMINDITSRKKIEKELQLSEETYRNLIEFAPDAFFQGDQKGNIITVNKKAVDYTDYSRDELLQMNINDLFIDGELEMRSLQYDLLNQGLSVQNERKIRKKNGEFLWVEMNSRKMPDNTYQSFLRDISERLKVEAELKEKENKFRILYENAPLSYQSLDPNSCLIDVNSTWLATLGYTRDEVIGHRFGEFMTPESAKLINTRFPEFIKNGEIHNFVFEMVRKDGSQLIVSYEGKVGNDEFGNFKQTHCIFSDITESKKYEKSLAEERILLRTLIDNLPDAIYAKDREGRKLFSNRVDIQNQGLISESQVIGKTDFDIFPEYLARKFHAIDQKVINTGQPVINHKEEFVFEDNKEHWLVSSKFPLRNEQNEIIGLVGISRDISEKVQAEKKIIQLSKGVEQSPASIIITNLNGNIEYVNSKFIDLTGYTLNEVKGKNPRILSSGETPKEEYKILWDKIKSGEEWKGEFHNKKKNGELYWESAIISPIRDEDGVIGSYLAIKEDITQRKQNEQQILKLNAGMNQSPASIIITNTQGIIEYVNKKFIETSGYSEAEFEGSMLRILKPDHTSNEIHQAIWDNLNNGLEWKGEHLNRKKNKETYWESILISPIKNGKNQIINFIAISEDISFRKQMETELVEAKEKAEESDQLKTAFLNNMSHEIRTPLNAIVGFSELLTDPDLAKEESNYYVEILHNSSDQLLHIISDIINISTIDAGQMLAVQKKMNVNNMLISLSEQFRLSNKNGNVEVRYVSTLNDQEALIEADETKLTQTISNLIVNALKFTEKGKVEFGVTRKDNFLHFWVEDTGIGISEKMHEKIFDRFRQADSSITKKYGGSGLGLSIAKSFIELLGGEIGLKSNIGEGSRFFFEIPYIKAT